jgi:hypothetical protein
MPRKSSPPDDLVDDVIDDAHGMSVRQPRQPRDPTTGRFLSADPAEPQQSNGYAYAATTPSPGPTCLPAIPGARRMWRQFQEMASRSPWPVWCGVVMGALPDCPPGGVRKRIGLRDLQLDFAAAAVVFAMGIDPEVGAPRRS